METLGLKYRSFFLVGPTMLSKTIGILQCNAVSRQLGAPFRAHWGDILLLSLPLRGVGYFLWLVSFLLVLLVSSSASLLVSS